MKEEPKGGRGEGSEGVGSEEEERRKWGRYERGKKNRRTGGNNQE